LESKENMRNRGLSSPDLADAVVGSVMTGWGGLPQNLNPKAHAQTLAAMDQVSRAWSNNAANSIVNFDFMP
jgi:hypothetical protein